MTIRLAILCGAVAAALAVPLATASLRSMAPPERNARPAPSPEAVQRLLDERRWPEALRACGTIAEDPGSRDLALFLFQYGTALARADQPEKAALMFMRQALLFPSAPQTAESLLESASILHRRFGDAAAAERLRQEAMAVARGQGKQALLRRAEALRRDWARERDRDSAHDPSLRR